MGQAYFFRVLAVFLVSIGVISNVLANDEPSGQLATTTVKQIKVPQLRVVDAVIEAVQQATVSAQTRGRITKITVDVDDYVTKGTVIIRMRDKEQRAAFDEAKARFEEAQSEHERVKGIYEKNLVAKASLDRAEAQLKATRAKMSQAKEALDYTQIRAPYSGIVVKRHVEEGEVARVGQALMTGLSLEKLRAKVDLPQSLIQDVRDHQQAWVWVGKSLEQQVKAEALTISPFADDNTHTFLVRVNLPVADHHVYPGMHTKVAFLTGETSRLVIPREALVQRSEITGVYVVDGDKLSFRYVKVGRVVQGNQIEVLSGLSMDETIALDPRAATLAIKTQLTAKE